MTGGPPPADVLFFVALWQMVILNQANADEFKEYWPYTTLKTKLQWRREHPRFGQ
jgi:hypothetical protein